MREGKKAKLPGKASAMTLRLTLRTLLSYLDDMLEPAQAKAIGAKVAESEQARDLVERIKQVTRRRRLTTPPTSGPGGMDANTIAEYLDNEATPEKLAEVEQICLASDVHLAEVAACHQILTLVLGEPALVPPSAKQRMYALVKGPESIPFRKPAKTTAVNDNDLSSEIELDQDDTLRLGAPAVGAAGFNRNVALIIGGGVLAVGLLIFAFWQLLHTDNVSNNKPKGDGVLAQNDAKDKDTKDGIKKDDAKKDDDLKKIVKDDKDKKDDKKPIDNKDNTSTDHGIAIDRPEIKTAPAIPYKPADTKVATVGRYQAPGPKDAPAILLQMTDQGDAERFDKNAAISSRRTLLSLPGSKSVVNLDTGVELTLWGNLPELTLDATVLESRVILNAPGQLDADVTLDRGRIVLRNKKAAGKEALIRVRFDDPMLGKEEYIDITLETPDAAVVLERYGELDREVPFNEDPKDKDRKGPIANLRIIGFDQTAAIRFGDLTSRVNTTSQPVLTWQNRQSGLRSPKEAALPPWVNGTPELAKDNDKLARKKAVAAHEELTKLLERKTLSLALGEIDEPLKKTVETEMRINKALSPDTFAKWRHVIRSYAAMDDMGYVFNTFSGPLTPIYIRGVCLQTIQQWLAWGRDQDYALLAVVAKNHRKNESIRIVELFHMVTKEDADRPATYQLLIEGLNNNVLAIRTLSHWHLLGLAPAGGKIAYDPAMPAALREAAVRQWTSVIPPGHTPSTAPPPPKKDKK